MASIAERMKTAMQIRGIKQVDLSTQTGIGKSSISTYLSGEYEPKQRNLYKIAKALDVDEGWLMGYDVPMARSHDGLLPPIPQEFIDFFNGDIERALSLVASQQQMQENEVRRQEMKKTAPEGLSYKETRKGWRVEVLFDCQTPDIQELIGGICSTILAIQKSWDIDGLNTLEALAQALPKLNNVGCVRLSEYVKMLSNQDEYTKENHQ